MNIYYAYEADTNMGSLAGRIDEKTNTQTPMYLDLVDDNFINKAKLKPVSNPIPFASGNSPNSDGIYSNEIFGTTPDSRQRQFAYINLRDKFFHPYVFEIIKTLDKKIEKISMGNGYWNITPKGELKAVQEGDKDFNIDNTGLRWLIDNFSKIKFKETNALSRKDKLKFINNLKPEEMFISKWLVIPVFYRGATEKHGIMSVSDIDSLYNKLISYTNGLDNNPFAFLNNMTLYNIQTTLVELRKAGGDLIRGKKGFLHRSVLGKSVDRGSRDVISVPVMDSYEKPEDNPIDIRHVGIPLAKCLVMGYDFVIRYCLNFFESNFKGVKDIAKGDTRIPIKDQTLIYTKEYIDKKMKQYINTPNMRFQSIEIIAIDGRAIPMSFVGQATNIKPTDPRNSSISQRPFTWTDLFYLAAMETLTDKYVYVTRFPITSYNSTFASLCYPVTTLNTTPAYVDGKFYPNYPMVDVSTPEDSMASKFIDTVCMSNLMLDIMGGDYDGDTVTSKMVFSLEANAEARDITQSPKNYLSSDGVLTRMVKNEAYLTFYCMTKSAS